MNTDEACQALRDVAEVMAIDTLPAPVMITFTYPDRVQVSVAIGDYARWSRALCDTDGGEVKVSTFGDRRYHHVNGRLVGTATEIHLSTSEVAEMVAVTA